MSDKHVYEVKIGHSVKAYAEAESPSKAKALALADLTVRRLGGGEVRAVIARGETILDGTPPTAPQADPAQA